MHTFLSNSQLFLFLDSNLFSCEDTANLAAILTQDYTTTAVSSIEEAIKLNYNFCSERKLMELVLGTSSDETGLQRNMFVLDPKSLGGDEQPGFNCPNCRARTRVFDQMRATHTDKSLYCNAALASLEDLEVLNKDGKHCDKVRVGEVVIVQSDGIPISSSREDAVGAFLQKLKNDGTLSSIVNADKPANNCPSKMNGEEGGTPSLSVQQMTGVWIIVFFWALCSLIARFYNRSLDSHLRTKEGHCRVISLQRYDQWCNPINTELEPQEDEDTGTKAEHFEQLDSLQFERNDDEPTPERARCVIPEDGAQGV